MNYKKIFGSIKKALFDDAKVTQSNTSDDYDQIILKIEALNKELNSKNVPQQQPLSAYESRRHEIEESSEPIEGIFYICDGNIIPDYYSECLFSEVDADDFFAKNQQNPRKRAMYHDYFFEYYILKLYTDMVPNARILPRGRVQKLNSGLSGILIDQCYFTDAGMIRKVVELYRLSVEISVSTNMEYRCPACMSNKRVGNSSLLNYTIKNGKSQ